MNRLKYSFWPLCYSVVMIFYIVEFVAIAEITSKIRESNEIAAPASDSGASQEQMFTQGSSSPRGSSSPMLTAESASPSTNDPVPEPTPPAVLDQIRRAAELAAQGDTTRAREAVRQAIRDCESLGDDNLGPCSEWMAALQGMRVLLDKPPQKIVHTNSLGMNLVRIPAGDYMMGSLKQEMDWLRLTFKKTWREGHKQWFEDELPLHPVRITKPFYMGSTEVTVGQFAQFVRETHHKTDAEKGDGGMIWSNKEARWVPKKGMKWDTLSWKISDNQPVVFVSWNDARAFCQWLSRKEKRTYRLPTEAEWEMACRAGAAWARYGWGNRLPGGKDMNFGDGNPKLPESLTTVDDGYEFVAPVGTYPPNAYGLYDMEGNVMEWVADYYDRNYYEGSPLEDPKGPSSGNSRVNKGGNWYASPADCRCAFRGFSGPEMSFWNLGFRVLMEEKDQPGASTAGKTEGSTEAETKRAALPPSDADGTRLFRQAMLAAQQQQWDTATQELEKALKIYQQREDPMWMARVKATLAGIYAEQNRTYKSKELYTQALAEFRQIGDTQSAKLILARLGELDTSPGVRVVEIQKGGIAEKAGVVVGDIIVEYAGETGFRVSGFKRLVEDYARAGKVTLSVLNNNEITTSTVSAGPLGIAVEDIKRPPRPRRPPEQDAPRERRPSGQRRDRR